MSPKEIRIILYSIAVALLIAAYIIWAHSLAFGNPAYIPDYEEDLHQRTVQQILILETNVKHIPCNYSVSCRETGIAQYLPESFDYLKRKSGMTWLDINNATDQVMLLDWSVRNGYGSWWATYQKAQQRAVTSKYVSVR